MLTRQLNINARKLLSFIIMLLAGAAVLSSSANNVFAEKVEIHRGNGGRTRPNVFKSGGAHGEYYTGNTPIYCVQPRDAALRNGRYSRERRTVTIHSRFLKPNIFTRTCLNTTRYVLLLFH